MKKILGLDLGTNSIGWAVVNQDVENDKPILKGIVKAGCRILPMDAAMMGDFEKGNSVSQTADRTRMRGIRRLRERALLRRERLHRVLGVLNFLPKHYAQALTRYGKFADKENEVKLPWATDSNGKPYFLFKSSFNEMVADFANAHPEIVADGKKIPYDWTIYYLRKKALSQPISREELSWILLHFNQKRGYYQLRGEEDDEKQDKLVEYIKQKIVRVEATDERKGQDIWYNVYLENGMIYRRSSKTPLEWEGLTKEFIVTTTLDENGQPKLDNEGDIKRSFKAPGPDDWTLLKKRTEADLEASKKYVGTFIYDALLQNPGQKILGKLVRVIERKYYRQELSAILKKQTEFIPELTNHDLYLRCINELYESNEIYRKSIEKRDFTYLFVDNILFYQRPLKSKKSLIDDCQYETRNYVTDDGEIKTKSVKCIAKSSPLYQEFRLWQFLSNLRIIQRECYNEVESGEVDLFGNKTMTKGSRLQTDVDVTNQFIKSEEDYINLFKWLNDREKITQTTLFSTYFKLKKAKAAEYRWNYVEDKEYPCNETRALMLKFFSKAEISTDIINTEFEKALWHILYSVEGKQDVIKALTTFAQKHNLPESFVASFSKFPPFKKEYGAYSEKAITKLLPLMRMGEYWSADKIDANTIARINKIINGEVDENIDDRTREQLRKLTDINQFKGMPLHLACYTVYGRHSEAKEINQWKSPSDIDIFLKDFRQHSLHNPVVEQVIMETLRTVRDIWKEVGRIDEIHVEMGREMKKTAAERKSLSNMILQNETTNMRIKAMLVEFMNPDFKIENVRPYSPSQQELLKIYEEGVLNSTELPEDIESILKKFSQSDSTKYPTRAEILRYKLWLEQNYFSPYTGRPIPLSKLFTPAYEIEHIIPQSRYFDDSLSNKVICETEVNKRKDRQLGYEFIKAHGGENVPLNGGGSVQILTVEQYEKFIKDHYSKNRAKMKKLLMDEIPDGFIERQMNDSRYISRYIMSLLSNIVRQDDEKEVNSANVIPCTGNITDRLKKEWGVNDKWNEIILPRFRRMNQLENTTKFTTISTQGHEIPSVPFELQRGFNKKRIDHRHHAMDAIVIACASRNIVNYLNNESARAGAKISRQDLKQILGHKNTDGSWSMNLPWASFPNDLKNTLDSIIVSFKQNLRVINKTTNNYQALQNGKKLSVKQEKGDSWAIRKSMHKETVFGEVNLKRVKEVKLKDAIQNPSRIVDKELREKINAMLALDYKLKQIKQYFEDNKEVWSDVNLDKINVFYYTKETSDRFFATRKPIDTSFDAKKIEDSITDTGIQKIMLAHLKCYDDAEGKQHPELAFSPEGIDRMNMNLVELNDGKKHQPIYKVRVYEKADKFAVGQTGNKKTKFVEAAKGTNLFFAIYETEEVDITTGDVINKRSYATIPLNVAIEHAKQGLSPAPENENGDAPKYILSPGDLVYVPDENENHITINCIKTNNIFKVVSFTGNRLYCIPYSIAKVIVDKEEYTQLNKVEFTDNQTSIKQLCIPVEVNRLGKIVKIG